ncbi:HAUS augmin-like complex subunit 3 [Sceloporus undulatus]|uniref:HAUS augmin-like complex subunit 3 n=1 Tax=Sceloporus undulatus TaxID=8520 RepID=UPI001C4BB869|nr:HAUS augmin-like complex subunit 3 [Sceloporus undulatus]XP_042321763.1 HAUS augmin-like complex subunit 3 [Sceloporus undulatus]
MDCGIQFVETLKRIGYPKAPFLNGEDFDWLFETLEDKSFLEWFCTSLNEHQVISEEELQSFNILLKSSKPVLEEEALDEVLKTCKSMELSTNNYDDDEDEEKLKTLQDEFHALQKMKQLKTNRLNKLQMVASTSSLMSLKLKERSEEILKNVKEGQGGFIALNTKINNELQSLTEGVEKLTSFLMVAPQQQHLGTHSVLLAQHDLDKYLHQEEESTTSLTLYTKKQFFHGMSELVESSNEENFQLLDMRNSFTCEESSDVFEKRLELTRLQMAYICAQHQLIQQKSKSLSIKSGLQWAKENISSLKKSTGKEEFEARISSLNNDISKLKKHLAHINSETLPLLIKKDAELLNMPVVRGDFDLQIARQEYYISKQDQICHQLIKQKASFEFLQLAYEIELRKLRDYSRLLENMVQDLKQSSDTLAHTLETMSDPSISHHKIVRSTVDLKDHATQRLYRLLEGKNLKQLFRTHEGLEKMSEELHLDTVSILDRLTVINKDQILLLSKIDADVIALRDAMYQSGESICLSNQELAEQFQRLEFQLNKLNQLIMDLLADIKAKKKVLENNKMQQVERKLCVYFFKDEECLKNVVERLEQQVKTQPVSSR